MRANERQGKWKEGVKGCYREGNSHLLRNRLVKKDRKLQTQQHSAKTMEHEKLRVCLGVEFVTY